MSGTITGAMDLGARLDQSLCNLGFDSGRERFEQLVRYGETFVDSVALEGAQGSVQDSLIPLGQALPRPGRYLVIDIGGTNVRAAVRSVQGDVQTWQSIPDCTVASLDQGAITNPLQRFSSQLFAHVNNHLDHAALRSVDGLAVVWSNAVVPYRLPARGGPQGIGALALDPERLSTKGEFFMRGLQSRQDLVEPFLVQAERFGISPRYFVISNDVPLCVKAPRGLEAHGAIVASTGANASLILGDKICNPEMGVNIKLAPELLSEPERLLHQRRNLQYLCSGTGLEEAMNQLVVGLVRLGGWRELTALAENLEIRIDRITAQEISALLGGDFQHFQESRDPVTASDQTCRVLSLLAQHLQERASRAAGLLAYLSVYNQLGTDDEQKVVVVESSLARNLPYFADDMQGTVAELSFGRIELYFQPADIEVTTPMSGAAHTLDLARQA